MKEEKARSDALVQRMSVLLSCFPFKGVESVDVAAAAGGQPGGHRLSGGRRGPGRASSLLGGHVDGPQGGPGGAYRMSMESERPSTNRLSSGAGSLVNDGGSEIGKTFLLCIMIYDRVNPNIV